MGQLILRQQAINMKFLIIALCLTAASAQRRGRQEALDAYESDSALDSYAADDAADPLAALAANIPGVPGEDYPIYAEVPESGFTCEGQVDGGYYADPEAECQAFHICTADGAGGMAKYSFLCPNGTLFNQNYFICDCSTAEDLYSLNDDIAAEREALAAAAADAPGEYGAPLEEEYAAAADYPEYEEAATNVSEESEDYGAPIEEGYAAAAADYPEYEEAAAGAPIEEGYAAAADYSEYDAVTEAADDYETVAVEELYAVADLPEEYGAPVGDEYAAADYSDYEEITTEAVPVYEAVTEAFPTYEPEARSARRFGGRRQGRRGGRRGQHRIQNRG